MAEQISQNEVRIVAMLVAKPGKESALRESITSILDDVRREQGCVFYNMHIDRDDPCRIVMLEAWESSATLDAHGNGRPFQHLSARFEELLAEPLSVIRLQLIA